MEPPSNRAPGRDPEYNSSSEVHRSEDENSTEGAEHGESRGLSDMLRKAMVAGLGSVFMSEGGVRALFKDLKLPKDVMGYMVSQAERSKSEFYRVIGDELRNFLESSALHKEISKLLADMTIEIKAEVKLRPESQGGPEVKVNSAGVRRSREE